MFSPAIDRAADMARFWLSCGQLALDTQSVVAMRLMGMNGTWAVERTESGDMLTEKAPAFTEACVSAYLTAVSGRGADRVMQAMIEPLSQKAQSNRVRLESRGPRLPVLNAATPPDKPAPTPPAKPDAPAKPSRGRKRPPSKPPAMPARTSKS